MSVGFRPTREDNDIIQAHKRPDETTADVLRRALRALDRERWEQQAREDMERIAASGEDLSDEPDDWGYDDAGQVVDFDRSVGRACDADGLVTALAASERISSRAHPRSGVQWTYQGGPARKVTEATRVRSWKKVDGPSILLQRDSESVVSWSAGSLAGRPVVTRDGADVDLLLQSSVHEGVGTISYLGGSGGFAFAERSGAAAEVAVRHAGRRQSSPVPSKLVRLRTAAARRARKR